MPYLLRGEVTMCVFSRCDMASDANFSTPPVRSAWELLHMMNIKFDLCTNEHVEEFWNLKLLYYECKLLC